MKENDPIVTISLRSGRPQDPPDGISRAAPASTKMWLRLDFPVEGGRFVEWWELPHRATHKSLMDLKEVASLLADSEEPWSQEFIREE